MLSSSATPRTRSTSFPDTLFALNRFRKTSHGPNNESNSRVVMVRKTDQRTFASMAKGQEPQVETVTRETVETFRGERSECKITTETKDCLQQLPQELLSAIEFNEKVSNCTADFERLCLQVHNEYRKKHGTPPLLYDAKLATVAQKRANSLLLRRYTALSHRRTSAGDFGENVYWVTVPECGTLSARAPIDSWYSEIQHYRFGLDDDIIRKSGHFTQLVWKGTRCVGVAMARRDNRLIVVASYYPAGNIKGEYRRNVPNVLNGNRFTCVPKKMTARNDDNNSVKPGSKGDFERDCLRAHNEYRRRHGAPPLKLDSQLSSYSQEWARHLAARNVLEHRPGSDYGENIFSLYSSNPRFTITGRSAVDAWYEEWSTHTFDCEPKNLKSGHFTQIVWKASRRLGVGVAKSGQGIIYVVANYCPAGNFIGSYKGNVLPPIGTDILPTIIVEDVSVATTDETSSETDTQLLQQQISVSSVDLDNFEQFAVDCLRVHNDYRQRHNSPKLRLDAKLCSYAQQWANSCARNGKMCHRSNDKTYGENMFCAYSSDYSFVPTAKDVVKHWYDEIKEYDFDATHRLNHKALHFTQTIWRSSLRLGVALSRNRKGETYVVANYEPRGNIVGQFFNNVNRPSLLS